jgi:VWFA-related protein
VFGIGRGAQAQGDGLTVTVVQVDDAAFPQVTVRFTVQDEDGLPATGLTANDLQVTEKGRTIPASSIALEGDTTQPIGLVLAIDVSVEESTFPQMKAAAKAFVEALGEQDQVAVLTFADEVRVVQDFGTRKEAAKVVDGLAIEGSYTVLNEATIQAATLASEAPLVRKAAVIVTDSPSNFGSALQETVSEIEEAGVTVHLIGFGGKIAPDRAEEMKSLARSTKGQAFVLPTVDEISDPLHTLNVLLHQGYKLSYQSDLQADNEEHTLSVRVTYLDREALVETSFVASPGEITAHVPGLKDGQQVGGIVHLTTMTTAPAPIVSVEYLLDDELLATTSEPPYRFAWDTTATSPGDHVLSVQVEDSAGNKGSTEVKLTVTPPVVAVVSAAQTQVKPGAEITVEAEATSLEELAYVEFLVDGKPVTTDEEAPYSLVFSSSDYVPGEHTITARAVDTLGRMDEARISVRVLAPPTPIPTPTPVPETEIPLRQAWPIGTVAAIVLIAGILTGLVLSSQRKRRRKVFALEIHNAGNIRDRYELWTEASNALRIRFALDGVPLTRREIVEVIEAAETVAVPGAATSAPGRTPSGSGLGEKAKGLGGIGTSIARALSSIIRFLPASIRGPLQRGLGQYYRGQSQVRRASIASSRLSRTASRVSSKAGQRGSAQPDGAAQGAPGQITRTAQVTRTVTLAGYQTPLVEPDEQLWISVLLDPAKPHYQSRDYLLKVFSRSIELEGAPMVIAQKSIQIQGVSLIRRILPFLLIYGAAVLSLFALQWILTMRF